jgi:hypothetical protein
MSLWFVRICALLIGLRSLTNFAKLFQGEGAILVVFGQILRGGEAALPALTLGLFMLVTAVAMWRPSRWALPLVAVYAAFVLLNLLLWTLTNPDELVRVGGLLSSATDPATQRRYGLLGMAVYSAFAIATTAVPAWLLWQRRRGLEDGPR